MSFWIEIHCENPAPIFDRCGASLCNTHRGDSLGVLAKTHIDAIKAMRKLKKTAKENGWKTHKSNFMCPKCAEYWMKRDEI